MSKGISRYSFWHSTYYDGYCRMTLFFFVGYWRHYFNYRGWRHFVNYRGWRHYSKMTPLTIYTFCIYIYRFCLSWLLCSSTFAYRPPYNNNKATFFLELNKSLCNITRKYKNILIIGDLNFNFDNLKRGIHIVMWYFLTF